jgi:type IV pilus assembly protein PilW
MKHYQRGFSLVELMIAITLGLLLSSAAISAFISVKKVNNTTSGVAGLADSGRFAFEQIGSAARTAGYLGCSASSDARIDLATTLPVLITDVGEPLAGYEYAGTGSSGTYTLRPPYVTAASKANWASSPTLGGTLDSHIYSALVAVGSTVGSPIAGSDVLAMHASPEGVAALYLTATASVGTATLLTTISSSVPNTGFASLLAAGSTPVAVVSNCQSAEVFAISGISGSQLSLSTTNANQTLVTAYSAGSHLTLLDTRVYYVGVGSDGEGALFVLDTNSSTAFAAPVELVPDVENMQVLYGVDTTGSKTTAEYVTADQVANLGSTGDFNSVIDVKIALLLVGPPGSAVPGAVAPTYSLLGTVVTAPLDTRLRSVFTTTFTLRNNAG